MTDTRPAETSGEHIALAQKGIATDPPYGVDLEPALAIRAALHLGAAIAISLAEIAAELHELHDGSQAIAAQLGSIDDTLDRSQ